MNVLKEGSKNLLRNIPGLCETINNLLRLKKGVVYNPDDYNEVCSIVGSVGEYDTTKIPTGILKLEKKLEERDKENIDKSLKAYLFGIYVALINAIKTDPYYVIKLFMFGLDLSDSEIEGLFNTKLISEGFPKFQYIRRIDNMINVFTHSLISNPSFEDVEFIKAIRLPKNIEKEYGGTGFINKLESIDNGVISKKKVCFTGRIQTFEDFFGSIYGITDKNEMIMTIISLPIRYKSLQGEKDEKQMSFFKEYMAPLFWYCLDILLYKYKKALIEQYDPKQDIQKYLLDEGFIEKTIGYNLSILNQSINNVYGDELYYKKIEYEIYHREEKILEEIYLFCDLISGKTNISDENLASFCMNMSPVYTKANDDNYWKESKDELPKDKSNFATFLLDDNQLKIPELMKFKPKQIEEDKNYKVKFAERHKEMILEAERAEEERIKKGIEKGIEKGRIRSVKIRNKYGSYRRRSYVKKQRRSKRLKRSKRKSNKKIKKRVIKDRSEIGRERSLHSFGANFLSNGYTAEP